MTEEDLPIVSELRRIGLERYRYIEGCDLDVLQELFDKSADIEYLKRRFDNELGFIAETDEGEPITQAFLSIRPTNAERLKVESDLPAMELTGLFGLSGRGGGRALINARCAVIAALGIPISMAYCECLVGNYQAIDFYHSLEYDHIQVCPDRMVPAGIHILRVPYKDIAQTDKHDVSEWLHDLPSPFVTYQ